MSDGLSQQASQPPLAAGGGSAPTVVVGPNFGGAAGDQFAATAALTMPSLTLSSQQSATATLTMPSLVLSHTDAVTAHLSGTALGAPNWLSAQTAALTSSGGSIAVAYPSGIVAGDLLVAVVGTSVGVAAAFATVNTPSGWTAIRGSTFTGASTRLAAYSFYRIADGTETGSVTFNFAASASQATAEIHRLNSTAPTTPINASTAATLSAAALVTDPVSPSVTTTISNCLVLAWLVHSHAGLSNSHTAPASHLERTDFQSNVSSVLLASTTDSRVFAAAAATGTATHDCTETAATDALMQRIAIAPGTLVLAT